jgi:hypothetical protein
MAAMVLSMPYSPARSSRVQRSSDSGHGCAMNRAFVTRTHASMTSMATSLHRPTAYRLALARVSLYVLEQMN